MTGGQVVLLDHLAAGNQWLQIHDQLTDQESRQNDAVHLHDIGRVASNWACWSALKSARAYMTFKVTGPWGCDVATTGCAVGAVVAAGAAVGAGVGACVAGTHAARAAAPAAIPPRRRKSRRERR